MVAMLIEYDEDGNELGYCWLCAWYGPKALYDKCPECGESFV